MFFKKRKILKEKYEKTHSKRKHLEKFIREKTRNGELPDGKWLEYMFIEHLHALAHSGEFDSIKSRLELEESKLSFLSIEFTKELEEYNRIANRENNIDQILNEN